MGLNMQITCDGPYRKVKKLLRVYLQSEIFYPLKSIRDAILLYAGSFLHVKIS